MRPEVEQEFLRLLSEMRKELAAIRETGQLLARLLDRLLTDSPLGTVGETGRGRLWRTTENGQVASDEREHQSTQLPVTPIPADLMNAFHRIPLSREEKESFFNRYCPIRLGVINRVEVVKDARAKAVFGESDSGQLIAVREGGSKAFVFPFPGLNVSSGLVESQALNQVFELVRYSESSHKNDYRVIEPALMDTTGNSIWTVVRLGKLDFIV